MDEEPEQVWDEYAWERFLQQQDQKTERYMQLLEQYLDHPNRDQIIACEMGWTHLIGDSGREWEEELEAEAAEHDFSAPEEEEQPEADIDSFEMHPLYRASFALTVWLDQFLEEVGGAFLDHPAAVKLATQSNVASSKLAAALTDDDVDEIGMTIAYLKRALKAVNLAMDAAVELEAAGLGAKRFRQLSQRIFQIRDGIVTLMGDYRAEWRRRYGQ